MITNALAIAVKAIEDQSEYIEVIKAEIIQKDETETVTVDVDFLILKSKNNTYERYTGRVRVKNYLVITLVLIA
ncbi:MAG: hypothetical protein RBR02_10170 [Desulfuromonadaceae bacterium]|nr:hypothetical protein [Desulfuromonadaceae bacterium]